jgi:mannose-6-phosphate isomerase-like protein (cupin superfamily)
LSGLDIDLATALAARLDVPLRLVPLGYDGLYAALRADQVDVLLSALRVDPGRMGDVHYTTGYFDAGQVLVRPPESSLDEMPAMDGRVIGVEFGSEGDQTARAWQRRLHILDIQPFETPSAALEAVQSGLADAALVDAIAARLWLRDHPGLAIAPEYVTHDPYAAAVRPDNSRLWKRSTRRSGPCTPTARSKRFYRAGSNRWEKAWHNNPPHRRLQALVSPHGEIVYELAGRAAGGEIQHSVAHIELPPGKASLKHFHPVAEESYTILSGTARLVLDGETYSLTPGQCVASNRPASTRFSTTGRKRCISSPCAPRPGRPTTAPISTEQPPPYGRRWTSTSLRSAS